MSAKLVKPVKTLTADTVFNVGADASPLDAMPIGLFVVLADAVLVIPTTQ